MRPAVSADTATIIFVRAKTPARANSSPVCPARLLLCVWNWKLIADVGFIGYPNAGKSSLLNELTAAKSKVANYPFTTLEPNLGVYYDLVLADIPGLIEGASSGKGLGIKFLRHTERTKILFHLVSAESEDPLKDYYAVIKELMTYNEELLKKPEYIFLAKSDLVDEKVLKEKIAELKRRASPLRPFLFMIFKAWKRSKKFSIS